METHIHDADSTPHQYWTKEEYNQIVESFRDDDQTNIHSEDVEVDAENMFTEEQGYIFFKKADRGGGNKNRTF